MQIEVDGGRRACVNLLIPDHDGRGAGTAADLTGVSMLLELGRFLARLGLQVRLVLVRPDPTSFEGPGLWSTLAGLGGYPDTAELVSWTKEAVVAVSPHDACAVFDEHGAVWARAIRRAVAGPPFLHLVADGDYLARYGRFVPSGAPACATDHYALLFGGTPGLDLATGDPSESQIAAVFDAPRIAAEPTGLDQRLEAAHRRCGLWVAEKTPGELEALGAQVLATAIERGAFAHRNWSFERLSGSGHPNGTNSTAWRKTVSSLDLCLRLGPGHASLSSKALAAAGVVTVTDQAARTRESLPWAEVSIAAPGVFADLVRAVERAIPLCENAGLRRRAATAAALPADWVEAFAPHAAFLQHAFARTLAAGRRDAGRSIR